MNQPPGWGPGGYGPPGHGPQPKRKGLSGAAIAVIILGGLFAMGIGSCALCVALAPKPNRTGGAVAAAPSAPGNDMPGSGETGYLNDVSGMQAYLVFPSKDLLETWLGASSDENPHARAILAGAFLVNRNTRVKNVGGSLMYLQVEILDGEQRGRRGWVDKTWVHKDKR